MRIDGDKIAEHRLNWDTLGLLQQLGAIPAGPGQPGIDVSRDAASEPQPTSLA